MYRDIANSLSYLFTPLSAFALLLGISVRPCPVGAVESADSGSDFGGNLARQKPAHATVLEKLSIEELTSIQVETVIGASKHQQKTTEATASVSIDNVFDQHYDHPVSGDFAYTGPISGDSITLDKVRQDGRQFRLKVAFTF